jgi:hypothetical protein
MQALEQAQLPKKQVLVQQAAALTEALTVVMVNTLLVLRKLTQVWSCQRWEVGS